MWRAAGSNRLRYVSPWLATTGGAPLAQTLQDQYRLEEDDEGLSVLTTITVYRDADGSRTHFRRFAGDCLAVQPQHHVLLI